ncbi:MAG: iron(III) transport system ATP-binding protein [Candidatus Endobugula sp.]|jgi:iron(III) transport system ATP-binding protein
MKTCVELVHLSLENVSVGYDGVALVHDVSLALGNGQIGCLLGPSGCGKSTLLRAIAGFESLISGNIFMNKQLLSSTSQTIAPEQRKIGMVFQDLALFPHLSIAENIAFGLLHHTPAQKIQRVQELLQLVGLSGMEERYPHSLSGGQQQRIALARAMAPKPQLLLLDEPFSGLDASMRETLVPEVREILLREEMSALLVTHDQNEAFAMADKVAVMNQGRVLQSDTAYSIYHSPNSRFVADFVGEGEFLHGIVQANNQVTSPLGLLTIPYENNYAVGQAVNILVRPDDLLHDDDSDVTAKIVNKKFRGSHFLYRVKLFSQQELYCFASSHHNHALGEEIGIKLDLDHLVMFAATPSI